MAVVAIATLALGASVAGTACTTSAPTPAPPKGPGFVDWLAREADGGGAAAHPLEDGGVSEEARGHAR